VLRRKSAQAAWSLLTKRASNRPIRGAAAAARNLLRQRAYPALCEGLACIGHPLLVARAKDVTVQTAARSCLVLAPHPDDETLGCGATIMRKLAAGTRVEIVIATDGRHSVHSDKMSADALAEIREEEARCAAAVLGLPSENIVFLRFEDGRLTDDRQTLRDHLFAIFDRINPDEIFVSSIIDSHPDHRVLAELGRELVQSRHSHFPTLYEYPIWFWDPLRWRVSELAGLRIRIVRTEEFLKRKYEAIAAYRSQLANLSGETGWATLRQGFVRQFLRPEETFFEVTVPRSPK
jgi:LmbE family N-acetylglucosaminyl deacetylase